MIDEAIAIIPARYASTRFPGKPLVEIAGKTMVRRVYEQCLASKSLQNVWVATDDARIFDHVTSFGGNVLMTADNHVSGTSRLAEASQKIGIANAETVIVNVQGDEPFIHPEQIDAVIGLFGSRNVEIGTLMTSIHTEASLFDPNVVKVVPGAENRALFFSRQPIPHLRGSAPKDWLAQKQHYKHVGLYAYRFATLLKISVLEPAPSEMAESLEQLRWLHHGIPVHIAYTQHETQGIDTPEDLLKLTNNVGF